jgi:osmotically-inducible protein OsmY
MNDRLYDDYPRDSRERMYRDGRREDRRFDDYGPRDRAYENRREYGGDRSYANHNEPRYNEPLSGGGEWSQQGSYSRGGREDHGAGPYEYSGTQRRDGDRGYGMERGRDRYFGARRRGFGRDYGNRYPLGSSVEEAWGRGGPGAERFAGESSYPRSHRGKGPSNYERSDERVKELICERLSDDDDIDASGISVTVSDGEAKLEGTVSSRWEKYLVEDCAEQCGAKEITNNLKIEARADSGDGNEWRSGYRGASDESRGQSSTGARPGNGGRSSTDHKATKSRNT